jgi:hypothetical protein
LPFEVAITAIKIIQTSQRNAAKGDNHKDILLPLDKHAAVAKEQK